MLRKYKKQIGVGGMVLTPLHKRLVGEVIDSGRLSYGPFLKRFEAEFARRHARRFAISISSSFWSSCIFFVIASIFARIFGV